MGDKATAKETMKKARCTLWCPGLKACSPMYRCQKSSQKNGLSGDDKATAGGGGKGMRARNVRGKMEDLINSAFKKSTADFGNGGMYMEKLI